MRGILMLEQPLVALFLRTIPENILLFYASYVIINTKTDMKKIIYSGIILGIINYLVRLLPINFGVHTILGLLVYIGILSKYHKVELFKSIKIALISMIILFISDAITVYAYINIFKISGEILFNKTIIGSLLSMPTLIIFVLILICIKLIKNRTNSKQEA
jgi:hypothetical protein